MTCMLVTLDTSHFDRSLLKELAPENIKSISVTPATSQDSIGPCEPLAQSPIAESLMHAVTAALSWDLVFGENVPPAVEGAGDVFVIGDWIGSRNVSDMFEWMYY